MEIDEKPVLANIQIPLSALNAQKKAFRNLEKKAATKDEIFEFTKTEAGKDVRSHADLDQIGHRAANDGNLTWSEKLFFVRMKRWLSNEGKKAAAEMKCIVSRRDKLALSPLIKQDIRFFSKGP